VIRTARCGGWIDDISEILDQFPAAKNQIQHLIFAAKQAQQAGNINAVLDLVSIIKFTTEQHNKKQKGSKQ